MHAPEQIVTSYSFSFQPQFAVGYGAATTVGLANSDLSGLGDEGFVLSSKRTNISGAYAVSGMTPKRQREREGGERKKRRMECK